MSEHICPRYEAAMEIIGKRWNGLILKVLMSGKKRFKDIRDLIPALSDRMLSERFKELEAAGIVTRHVYAETPVRVEYELTEMGKTLGPALDELQKWAETWWNK
jgi:DNA-binding HxlR family transcriptional regulator